MMLPISVRVGEAVKPSSFHLPQSAPQCSAIVLIKCDQALASCSNPHNHAVMAWGWGHHAVNGAGTGGDRNKHILYRAVMRSSTCLRVILYWDLVHWISCSLYLQFFLRNYYAAVPTGGCIMQRIALHWLVVLLTVILTLCKINESKFTAVK